MKTQDAGYARFMWRSAVMISALTMMTACGAEQGATEAAERFGAAVEQHDYAAACGLLAPKTLEELEISSGASCDQALEQEQLPTMGGGGVANVYGEQAQVTGVGDTVFLHRFGEEWRVVAAGCEPRRDAPYHCALKGA